MGIQASQQLFDAVAQELQARVSRGSRAGLARVSRGWVVQAGVGVMVDSRGTPPTRLGDTSVSSTDER